MRDTAVGSDKPLMNRSMKTLALLAAATATLATVTACGGSTAADPAPTQTVQGPQVPDTEAEDNLRFDVMNTMFSLEDFYLKNQHYPNVDEFDTGTLNDATTMSIAYMTVDNKPTSSTDNAHYYILCATAPGVNGAVLYDPMKTGASETLAPVKACTSDATANGIVWVAKDASITATPEGAETPSQP